jgi:hypothetical protein
MIRNKKKILYFIIIIVIILFCYLIYNRINVSEYFTDNDLSYLTVYKSRYNKKRIGNSNDGGYVIINIDYVNYDLLLSGGISNDSTFEDEFLSLYPQLICYAFDGTIEESPSQHKNFNFIKKNIGPIENNITTNLNTYLDNYHNIFLKMDIEGHEIAWFESLNDNQLNNISQIAIEFHAPFTKKEEDVFKKINNLFVLLHFHGNNNADFTEHKSVQIPSVFECTYINKKYVEFPLSLNDEIIPSIYDAPNDIKKSDLIIDYPPFVNRN